MQSQRVARLHILLQAPKQFLLLRSASAERHQKVGQNRSPEEHSRMRQIQRKEKQFGNLHFSLSQTPDKVNIFNKNWRDSKTCQMLRYHHLWSSQTRFLDVRICISQKESEDHLETWLGGLFYPNPSLGITTHSSTEWEGSLKGEERRQVSWDHLKNLLI